MADEREGVPEPRQNAANRDRIQTGGRRTNAAQPSNAAEDRGGVERYPAVDQTDAVQPERRSFDPPAEGRLGPAGDPAEGKR